jgi:3-phosphoshikimate 1-carboxyvinyltransferase
METMQISKPENFNAAKIVLPGSKSESNRALILQALSTESIQISNLSNSEDTNIIQQAVSDEASVIDCHQSGAALRFLTAYFACQKNKTIILTGSQRLKERPLKILIDALIELGADIEYLEKTGYAPIKIKGKELISHQPITIQANVSSQFISALLMIAPKVKNGLQLHLENNIISAPYLKMTMQMMREAKIHIIENNESIIVPEQEYQACNIRVESDWSAASYWYGFVSLGIPTLSLKGLHKNSLQGDAIIAAWMKDFGVQTQFTQEGVILKHTGTINVQDAYNFINCPDLAQTIIVLAALQKKNIQFNGIESLAIKETDRIEALKTELQKINVSWEEHKDFHTININECDEHSSIEIDTYHDHRMAMAFAMLAMRFKSVYIEDGKVVNKSYPNFWEDLMKLGFVVW